MRLAYTKMRLAIQCRNENNMKATELRKRYLSGERQFIFANLSYANLENTDLRNADLYSANLRFTNLAGANLYNANLRNANLSNANLLYANLYNANLKNANLRIANLRFANLEYADLKNANLRFTNLENANLSNANLTGTILDPWAKIPEKISDKEILSAGLEIHGEYVAGYRTKISVICGCTEYKVGEEYKAPVFSVDQETACHPGIYLASKEWLLNTYGSDCEIVRCFCRRDELIHAWDKWRAKRIRVIEG